MGCLARSTFLVMTFVILSGGMKMRDEHGMLREVCISCHAFCHTFRSSMDCLGRYIFALCFFFAASFTASVAAFREALSCAASFASFRQLLCHTLCAQKQIEVATQTSLQHGSCMPSDSCPQGCESPQKNTF